MTDIYIYIIIYTYVYIYMYVFICICLNRSKPAPFFFCPSLQSLYLAMTRGRAVCWQAQCQRECARPSQAGTVEPFLAAYSDVPLANAIPPKFEYPRVSTHCWGLEGRIEVLTPQCKPEDIIVQLHAVEPALCRQHFPHRLLGLFLILLAGCLPHAPKGIVVEVLHVKFASMQTCMQRLLGFVEQSCM